MFDIAISAANPIDSAAVRPATTRPIVHRTRGRGHDEVYRLMSPNGLGEQLKPFVFLDSFAGNMSKFAEGGSMHPHSGIATVTVFTRGDVHFEAGEADEGYIGYGGVKWMRAGGGVWHGKELSSGKSDRIHGFQLWLALPEALELSEVDSQYIEASDMNQVGPAYVILGEHKGVASPVRSPAGINYLLVTLEPGQAWSYAPPKGQTVGWLALSHGALVGPSVGAAGELLIFDETDDAIVLEGGSHGASFVLGSAIPHPHNLHLGYYSVHTSAKALIEGEAKIDALKGDLLALGDRRRSSGAMPIFRG